MVPGFHKRNVLVGSEARFRKDGRQTFSYSDCGRVARHPTGIVRILGRSVRLLEVRHSRSTEHRRLFRLGSLVSGLERGNPCSRCLSKSLPEKFDEGARLPIADLGRNRFYRTSCNQQLYSFHQTHLPSPKLETRPNFFAENSLDCPDAYTDFSTQRIQ